MAENAYTVMTIGDAHAAGTSNLADLIPGVRGGTSVSSDYMDAHSSKKLSGSGGAWWGLGGSDAMLGSTVAMRFDGWRSINDTAANKPNYVRRPMSGIAVKPNTHAFISVVRKNSQVVKVFNDIGSVTPTPGDLWATMKTGQSTAGLKQIAQAAKYEEEGKTRLAEELTNSPLPQVLEARTDFDRELDTDAPQADRWTDWFLQQVTEVREEKFQITDTFGETAFNAFGQRPRMLSMRGYLLNTSDFNWRAEFWHNWDNYFRATKLIENDCQVYIGFDDIIVSGYPLNATAKQTAEAPNIILFQFSFLVTSYTNMSMKNIGQMQAMRRAGVGADGAGKAVYLDRSNEFIRTGDFSYADWSSDRGQAMMSKLSTIVGGNNLAFKDMTQTMGFGITMGLLGMVMGGTLFGVMGARAGMGDGGIALAAIVGAAAGAEGFANPMGGLLFDSALRFIKGGNTMMQYISSNLHQKAIQGQQQLTLAAGKGSIGGLPGLNFWFGFVGTLYTVIGVNMCSTLREPSDSVYDIGKAGAEGAAIRASYTGQHTAFYNNRWMKMVDHVVQMGSMEGLLSYVGYAASAAIQTAWLKADTSPNSYKKASNLSYSGSLGFYAAGSAGIDTSGLSYGGDVSWSEYGGGAVGEMQGSDFSSGYGTAVDLPPQKKGDNDYWEAQAAMYADPQWSNPGMSSSDQGASDNSLIKDLMTEAEFKKQKEKEAVYAQQNQVQSADGALVPVVNEDASVDDGTEGA